MDWQNEVDMAKVDIGAALNSDLPEEAILHLRYAIKHLESAIEELED